jgi:hypothetical protein
LGRCFIADLQRVSYCGSSRALKFRRGDIASFF